MLKCKQCGYQNDDNSIYPLNIKKCPVCGKNLCCTFDDIANALSDDEFFRYYLKLFGKEGLLDKDKFLNKYNNAFSNRITANKAYNAILPTQAFKDVLFAEIENIDDVIKKSIKTLELEGISKIWSKAIFNWLKEAMYGKLLKNSKQNTKVVTTTVETTEKHDNLKDTSSVNNIPANDDKNLVDTGNNNNSDNDNSVIAESKDFSYDDNEKIQISDEDLTIEKVYYYDNNKQYKKAFEIAKRLPIDQDSRVSLFLGYCYHTGFGVELDFIKAVDYYKKAIQLGSSVACKNLGICYYDGNGVEQDYTKAIEYYNKAIELGCLDAYNDLGNCYYDGRGVEQNYAKAVEYYNKAIEAGCNVSYGNLGNCYYNGNGVKKDINKALQLYEKSTDNNNFEQNTNLGFYYESKNEIKALKYYILAYDNNAYLTEKNYTILNKVSTIFRKLTHIESNSEFIPSSYIVGSAIRFTPIDNTLKELAYYQNNALAQYYYDYLLTYFSYEYINSAGKTVFHYKNSKEHTEYYNMALKNNFIYALYFSGEVEKSAKKGFPLAIKKLADKYYDEKEYEKAYEYYKNIYQRVYLSEDDKLDSYQIYKYINTIFMFNKGEKLLQMINPFIKEKNIDACTILARYYFEGRDCIEQNYVKAFECLKDLDNLDFSDKFNIKNIYSAYILGFCYLNGYGCEKNIQKACYYLDNSNKIYKDKFNFKYEKIKIDYSDYINHNNSKYYRFLKDNKTNLEIKLFESMFIIENGTTYEYKNYHIESLKITSNLLVKQAIITTYTGKKFVFKDKNIVEALKKFKELNNIN